MNDSDYRVTLRSYCPNLKSIVKIKCEDYNVFKELVDAVTPILEKEDCKERKNGRKLG